MVTPNPVIPIPGNFLVAVTYLTRIGAYMHLPNSHAGLDKRSYSYVKALN